MAGEFWLSEAQWGAIGPLLPKNQPGARRTDDRRVISGIVQDRLSVAGLPGRLRAFDDDPQSLSPAGRCAAFGAACLTRWRAPIPAMVKPSTARGQGSSLGGGRKRGAQAQAIGRSRGGRTTKIHAIVDARGRPIAIEVTPGHLGDVQLATALISAVPPGGCLVADAAYDSSLRRFLLERGTVPVIPNNPTRKRHHPFDETAYRQRNLIERMFRRLKDWRRIATRYDKLAANFAAAIMLAAVIIWWT